jgi:5'-nucleotidase
MTNQRRRFIGQLSLLAGAVALNKPFASIAAVKNIRVTPAADNTITIYHTNDLHGNLSAVYKNMGGLNHIKSTLSNNNAKGLLLDGGSFLNKTQTYTEHKKVIEAMNSVGYHAAAIGSHELSKGEDYLAQLAPLMQFTLVNCNYQLNYTLSKFVKPYIVVNTGKLKVGITGVGQPDDSIIYNDAIKCANKTAALLKNDENCDLVICISHLGNNKTGNIPDNQKLAKQSANIDMIIGGDNRKIAHGPTLLNNSLRHEIFLCQAGFDGLMMGKMDYNFDDQKQKSQVTAMHLIPGKPENKTFAASLNAIGTIRAV